VALVRGGTQIRAAEEALREAITPLAPSLRASTAAVGMFSRGDAPLVVAAYGWTRRRRAPCLFVIIASSDPWALAAERPECAPARLETEQLQCPPDSSKTIANGRKSATILSRQPRRHAQDNAVYGFTMARPGRQRRGSIRAGEGTETPIAC
jgi:hypothetical protein